MVSASVSSAERRRKEARRGQGDTSRYSEGAEEDFSPHHASYYPPATPM